MKRDPRHFRRLSDQITTSFYEACQLGSLETARCLMHALECEAARAADLVRVDGREDGNDVVAVQARFTFEMKKLERGGFQVECPASPK